MIQHVHARASAAARVDAVLIATDDERIARAVDAFGGTAVMTGTHHATGTDRLAEVAAALSSDIVVNVQGDEPLIDAGSIDACIQSLTDHPDAVMSTVRRPLADGEADDPSVVKVVVDRNDIALYFSRSPIPHVRRGNPEPARWAHLGLYGYRRTFLLSLAALPPTPLEQAESLEQLRVLEHGFRMHCVTTVSASIGVDTAEDLERVRELFATLKH
jgi:3-deoxy-manno-octulosonate cytidylyltransferase (CMP-KDO synthetase)